MNHFTKIIFISMLILFIPAAAQVPDLVLQTEITPQYNAYLDSKEAEYLQLLPGSDDTPTMKAHMGLAILNAARTYINGDTLSNDLNYLMQEMGENIDMMIMQTYDDIVPLFDAGNPNDFVLNLIGFFESGTYPAYRDSIDAWLTNNSLLTEDMRWSIDHFGETSEPLMDAFGEHWQEVADGTADFEFNVQVVGSEYEETLFEFSRLFFDRLDMISVLSFNTAQALGEGFGQILDSVNNNSANIDPGVLSAQNGLDSLVSLIDSIQVLLWSQPFAPFEFELDLMDSLKEGVSEFDALLGGKEYPIGPEAENKVIRPRGIIESLADHDGPMGVYQDYYRTGELTSYTFGNTFPRGLTADMYAMIASDIILNANDSRAAFEIKVHAYQTLLNFKPVKTPDEHFGLALTLAYDLLTDEEYFKDIEKAVGFISEGRIDSLIHAYSWSSFDLQDKISEIRFHIDQYINSEALTNYVILFKQNDDGLGPYILGPNSDFSITYLTVPQIMMATKSIEMMIDAMSMMADAVSVLYNDIDQMFIMNLDPNVLDFSQVESELDFILILEQSNPNFMSITSYGIDKFHEIGDQLEASFENFGIFFDNLTTLMDAMTPYQDDFDMNAEEMSFIMEMMTTSAWELWEDFAFPDSTHWNGTERVNLSAWFDNPPASFLIMLKNYFMGTDSTLGGLFPDRFKINEVYEVSALPKQFKLYPVYPNPFNPATTIEFDLPREADVRLTVLNLNGEQVAELVNNHYMAGKVIAVWNAHNFPSGIYFSRLSINGEVHTRKMTLMK